MLGSVCHPDAAGPPQGRRPPARVHRHHGRDRLAGPQAVVRRRDELPRPGRHPRPPGAPRRVARADLRAPRPGPADRPRVQVLRAGVLRDRRARLGDGAAPLPRARRPGEGRARHRPPRAGNEHRVHRRPAPARRPARRVRLQLAVLRGRRPDGRRGGPVPAVPDHARGRHRRRPGAGAGRRVHARPVPQHRAEDPGPDPIGDERPGGDGQGAARRPRGAARRPGARATSSARTRSSWTPTTPTSGRSSPSCAPRLGLDPDPMAAYARSGYAERIAAERVGGSQAGWGA